MLEKLKEIIAEKLGVEIEEITEESRFKEDLKADSLDLFELVMAIEEEFGNSIPSEDLEKLASALKVYLTNGGGHIQFNIVNKEEMEDAKQHPEEHPDLIVRVAGYSAYFVQLSEGIQDEVIERSSHAF